MDTLFLDGQSLTLFEIEAVALRGRPVGIAPAALARIAASRKLIESILAAGQTVLRREHRIWQALRCPHSDGSLAQLQTNLVRSHAGESASLFLKVSRGPCCCCGPMCLRRGSAVAGLSW